MANDTADLDWIDCHDLRREDDPRWDERESSPDKLGSELLEIAEAASDIAAEARITLDFGPPVDPEKAAKIAAEAKAAAKLKAAQDKAKAEMEAKQKAALEARAKKEAEQQAKREAEEKARRDAAAKAKAEAEEKARQLAEAKAKREAAFKAKKEAAEKARKAAEAKAREEAEERARARAEAKAKKEAEAKAKREAEEKAKAEAEAKAKAEAEEKARKLAEAKAKKEAEAKAKREAEEKAKKEAEEKARKAAEAKAKKEAEEKARKLAEAKAKKEAEAKAKKEAEEKAKREAEEKARKEAEAKAKAEAEEKARIEAEAKAKAEAEEKARLEAEEQARKEAEERAKIPLGDLFKQQIEQFGPISLAQYMAESNARYYSTRDPLGEDSDFITAPEISQMFGELIGLWLADVWVNAGAPDHIHWVELGPGRGTLTIDALRTAERYGLKPKVHFVEGSETLRGIQAEAVKGVRHHHDLTTIPTDGPVLFLANEFFDALPIHQLIRSAQGWHEREVALGESGEFIFIAGNEPMDDIVPSSWRSASQGTMIETSPAAVAIMTEISDRLREQGGAALIIDYGSRELRAGSTLQAIRQHQKVDVFAHPGEADLTAHVDFELLQDVAKKNGATPMGLAMQGDWLIDLGIDTRTEALQRKDPSQKDVIKRQRDRLVEESEMGLLFKVLGIAGTDWPKGVGF